MQDPTIWNKHPEAFKFVREMASRFFIYMDDNRQCRACESTAHTADYQQRFLNQWLNGEPCSLSTPRLIKKENITAFAAVASSVFVFCVHNKCKSLHMRIVNDTLVFVDQRSDDPEEKTEC